MLEVNHTLFFADVQSYFHPTFIPPANEPWEIYKTIDTITDMCVWAFSCISS